MLRLSSPNISAAALMVMPVLPLLLRMPGLMLSPPRLWLLSLRPPRLSPPPPRLLAAAWLAMPATCSPCSLAVTA